MKIAKLLFIFFTSNFDKVKSVLLEAGVSQHNMINTAKGVRLLSKDMDISEVNKLLTHNDVHIEGEIDIRRTISTCNRNEVI